ncbi:tripartite motif-containing protein 65, partial [Astyanax mexicanus]
GMMEAHNLSCAICLDRFKYPTTIPCGHTFCMDCISKYWDQREKAGPQSAEFNCPVCNEKFPSRPTLKRNVSLSMLTEATANSAVLKDDGASCRGDSAGSEQLCGRHQKPLVMFCRNDGMCVCCACAVNECKNHDKVLVEEERKNREVRCLFVFVPADKGSSSSLFLRSQVSLQQTSQWVNAKFSQLLKVLVEKQELTQRFVDQQQETALCQAEAQLGELQEKAQQLLEQEEQISSLCTLSDYQLIQVHTANRNTYIIYLYDFFLFTDHCSLTFDPRTANAHLLLSQSNRRAEHLPSGPRPVPAHEARFDHTWQVLCFENFTHGRHYWELEVSKPWAYVGVTYQAIPRKEKGKTCMLGMNELSWSLQLDERQLSAWHAGRRESVAAQLQVHTQPLRIGMLLDYEGGTLTYYGEGQVRLHAFHCVFSQELFPACWIGEGVSVTLCPP